jgi:hypothetical protein
MSMIIQTALVYLVSDKGGSWLAKILSEKGLFGFGSKVAKKLAHRRLQRNGGGRKRLPHWTRVPSVTDY